MYLYYFNSGYVDSANIIIISPSITGSDHYCSGSGECNSDEQFAHLTIVRVAVGICLLCLSFGTVNDMSKN